MTTMVLCVPPPESLIVLVTQEGAQHSNDLTVGGIQPFVSFRQACKTFAREPGETGRRQASSDLIADMLPAE